MNESRPGVLLSRRAVLGAGTAIGTLVALGGHLPGLAGSAFASPAAGFASPAAGPSVTPGTPWATHHGLTTAGYQAAFDRWTQAGYRPVHVAGYDTSAGARYIGIWEKSSGPAWVARHGLTAGAYQSAFTSLTSQGYRLRTVSGYTDRNAERYAAIWEKAGGPAWVARHGLTAGAYQSTFTSLTSQGYRLKVVSGYTVGGVVRYAAVWERSGGPAWAARHGLTSAQHQSTFNSMVAAGYRLTYVDGYATPQGQRFAAIYERSGGPAWEARHDLTSSAYQQLVNSWSARRMRPLTVSGYSTSTYVANQQRFATIWVRDS